MALRGCVRGLVIALVGMVAVAPVGVPVRAAAAQELGWAMLAPFPRFMNAMAYDSRRGVVVMFGGTDHAITDNRTWEWNGQTWALRSQAGGPIGRTSCAMAYDSIRGVTVLFGGSDAAGTALTDTWEWDGEVWTQRDVLPPAFRSDRMVFDSARGVCVMVDTPVISRMAEWNGTAWVTRATPQPVPPARTAPALAFDPVRNRLVMFGGRSGSTNLTDLWEWDGAVWTPRPASGAWPASGSMMTFDSVRGVCALLARASGGVGQSVWEWNGSDWGERTSVVTLPDSPSGAIAFDGARGRLVQFGGQNGTGYKRGETWEWDGQVWVRRTGEPPSPWNVDWKGAFDASAGVIVARGGTIIPGTQSTWTWDGRGWTPRGSAGPSARTGAAMAYDAARGVVLLIGGTVGGLPPLAEHWEWDGQAWTQRSGTGVPSRHSAALAFDSDRNRCVLFGGIGPNIARMGDTWEFDGSTWTQRATTGPSPRSQHVMVFDSVRNVTVLFGGSTSASSVGDTWEWDGSAWTQRNVTGPAARTAHGMVFDSARGVTVLHGGTGPSAARFTDTWEWDGAAWTAQDATGIGVNSSVMMVFDSIRKRSVVLTEPLLTNQGHTWGWGPCTPPTVAQPPQSAAVAPGGAATFTVVEQNTPAPAYRWRRNGVPLTTSGVRLDGVSAPTLTIHNAGPGDAGEYDVVITTICGSTTSAPATLTINTNPPCPADFDHNGTLDPADVATFVGVWFASLQSGGLEGDFDQSGAVDPADVAAFVQAWFAAVAAGGC